MQYHLLVGKTKTGPFDLADLLTAPGFTPESLVAPQNKPIKKRSSWKSARRFKDIAAALKLAEKALRTTQPGSKQFSTIERELDKGLEARKKKKEADAAPIIEKETIRVDPITGEGTIKADPVKGPKKRPPPEIKLPPELGSKTADSPDRDAKKPGLGVRLGNIGMALAFLIFLAGVGSRIMRSLDEDKNRIKTLKAEDRPVRDDLKKIEYEGDLSNLPPTLTAPA